MDVTQYTMTNSNDFKAIEYKGESFKATIERIEERHYDARDGQIANDKLVLFFADHEKGLVLNKTNTRILLNAYSPESDKWIGETIGLSTQNTDKGEGWVVTALGVKPKEFNDDIPF